MKFKLWLHENIEDVATKIFVMKSPYTPNGWKFDHIGFVLQNGLLKDMSGHRYDQEGIHPLPPVTYKYEDTEKLFHMPKNKQEAILKGLYQEKSLPKPVVVPNVVVCNSKEKAVNCGSFIKIVLSNNGIETTQSNMPFDIFNSI